MGIIPYPEFAQSMVAHARKHHVNVDKKQLLIAYIHVRDVTLTTS